MIAKFLLWIWGDLLGCHIHKWTKWHRWTVTMQVRECEDCGLEQKKG